MLAIRLTRIGAKKRPAYRIIVSEKRYKRDGAYIENLGHYNPLTEPATMVVNRERFDYWVKAGAQPSDVVKRLVLGINGTKHSKPKKAAQEKAEAALKVAESAAEAPVVEASAEAVTTKNTPEPVKESAEAEQVTEDKTAEAETANENTSEEA